MSYLLEALGRGLLTNLRAAFENQLPPAEGDDLGMLEHRAAASPNSLDLALRLAVSCLRAGRLTQARQEFERAAQLNSSAALPFVGLACVYDELGQTAVALQHLERARACDPGDPAVSFGIGFCLERLGRMAEARAAYAQAIEQCPQLRNAYERLAAIAIRDGDWAGAIAQYERLADMEPDDLDVLLTLGNLYLQAERPEEAIEQYQQALFVEPETEAPPFESEELVDEGRLRDAITALEKLIRKYPGVAPFHVQLGDLYVRAGQDLKAIEQYRLALEAQPSFLEATVKLGTQHMRQGRLVDAAITFNRAVELNDRLITAFVGLGVAQHACGRHRESLATFDLAASLEPSTTLLFSESARLQLQLEQRQRVGGRADASAEDDSAPPHDRLIEEALRRHEQALAQTPGHADLHYRYGLLLRQVGRLSEAIEAFRRAVAINPHYSKALVKLAICLKEAGQIDEAIETFTRALRLNDKFVDVHYQLGLLFAQRAQFELAVEQFERAIAGNERNLAFRANLALALQNIGLVDRAAATWRSICELSRSDPDLLAARERILRDAGRRP
jgi:tetratricopeptide (TPR) repeat protein